MSTARVDFTRGAAERIARVVRLVEQGERDQTGPRYDKVDDGNGGGAVFRVGRFVGPWYANTDKVVELYHRQPKTVIATNIFCDVPGDCPEQRWCAIAKDGGTWYMIQAQCGDV